MLPGYTPLRVSQMPTDATKAQAIRLNSLCNLHYFIKVVLRKNRLTEFHEKYICKVLESYRLKLLLEIPRDHFKTTCCGEGYPMWSCLRVSKSDEDTLAKLGYSDDFVRLVKHYHDPNGRILIVSEVEKNALKIGSRISQHYKNNDLFRTVFPDLLPDANCIWNAGLMTHKRDDGQIHGEGTYNFLGTGSALQSNHFTKIIQDDLVGRDSEESHISIDDGIRYHQLLLGAFDSVTGDPTALNDEIVVGNRWAEDDLNDWIRKNEPDFTVISHDALGGCCDDHPAGVPIFPEEFSLKKLKSYENRQGPYIFSCQFRNKPVNQSTRVFKEDWLRFYTFEKRQSRVSDKSAIFIQECGHEEVDEGGIPFVNPQSPSVESLYRYMIVDPNHKGDKGRCNHSITVTGIDDNNGHKYLLEAWAESSDFTVFISEIYRLADKWKLWRFWLETVGAQTYLKYHIEQENIRTGRRLQVESLTTNTSANSKDSRIRSLVPYFYNGEIYVRKDQEKFLYEYRAYPHSRTKDTLDTLGYAPQVWDVTVKDPDSEELFGHLEEETHQARMSFGVAGY